MVVFTCNHCGDSLQKPRVEKHYMIACRTAKSLTCMDCLKDFRDEEYMTHTKCVSETQRYGAKGSAVEEVKKGEVKQENWTNFIKDVIIKSPDVPISYLTHLQTLSQLNNVPRTKEKFVNFLQNSGGRNLPKDLVNGLWDFIEKHKAQYKEIQEKNKKSNQKESSSSELEKNKPSRQENRKINKQLKKIDNQANNCENHEDEDNGKVTQEEKGNQEDENNAANDSPVQVKPKKRKSDAADEESCKKQRENSIDNELNNSAAGIKKGKKKKKNSSAFENLNTDAKLNGIQEFSEIATQNQETAEIGEDKSNDSIRVKTKKRKSDAARNKLDVESCEKQKENGFYNELDNSATEIKKDKKRKKKNSSAFENLDTVVNDAQEKEVNNSENAAQNQGSAESGEDQNSDSIRVKTKKRKSDAASIKIDEETCKKQKENGFYNELDNSATEDKKEKKKKKISSSHDELKQVDNSNAVENQKIIENAKTAKKKDKKQSCASDFFTEENVSLSNKEEQVNNEESNSNTKEKPNKKMKGENVQAEKDSFEVLNNAGNSFLEAFPFQDKILDILNSKNSISLNKLQKKVLKAYKKTDDTMPEEKLLKKISRTLKKLNNIEVSNDIVKLITV